MEPCKLDWPANKAWACSKAALAIFWTSCGDISPQLNKVKSSLANADVLCICPSFSLAYALRRCRAPPLSERVLDRARGIATENRN